MDVINRNEHLHTFIDGNSIDNTVLIAQTNSSVMRGDEQYQMQCLD